jgi:hypothetical protein
MLRTVGFVLFAIGMVFYVRLIGAIWRLVDECRAHEPSQKFSKFFWISAWRYHKRRLTENPLRKQIVYGFVLTWLFGVGGFALIVLSNLNGHWPQ